MKILALDTSTEHCSVALRLGVHTDAREVLAGQQHSRLLLGMIDELLNANETSLRDLDAIAYGEGPGSFTGLRIACGVVQGLALGGNVRVVGIGTLLAMAAGSSADRVVCCVDARVKEIYHASFTRVARDLAENGVRSSAWQVVDEPRLCAPGDAPALEGDGWLACGDAFAVYADVLEARYAGQLAAIEAGRYPHAREIAELAAPLVERGATQPPEAASPLYLRNKVALRTDERAAR